MHLSRASGVDGSVAGLGLTGAGAGLQLARAGPHNMKFLLKKYAMIGLPTPSRGGTAENSDKRRGEHARFERGMVSSDVDRGRVAVARVRTCVSTRHRRFKEREGTPRKSFMDEQINESNTKKPEFAALAGRKCACCPDKKRRGMDGTRPQRQDGQARAEPLRLAPPHRRGREQDRAGVWGEQHGRG